MKRINILQIATLLMLCAVSSRAADKPDGPPQIIIRRLLSKPSVGRAGQPMEVTALIANQGAALKVTARWQLPPGMALMTKYTPLSSLATGEIKSLTWTIHAVESAQGDAILSLSAGGETLASATLPVNFLAPIKAKKQAYIPDPQPVKTQMLVGALNCPLWESDKFSLWDQVLFKHPERVPALGFYAQENPEVADWETKWAVEHGISFFTYCWYRDGQGGAIKTRFGSAIHDALFKSRFANKMKFTIMWENQSKGTSGVADEQDLMNNLLPYWMENYFKNPNYLKVDNKPVFFIYRPENLVQDLGGVEKVPIALDKMRAACRRAGFDGLYILGEYRGVGPNVLKSIKQLGLDYTFAYCWGIGGSPAPEQAIQAQMNFIKKTQEISILPQVVTVSQAWSGWQDEGSVWKLPPAAFEKLLRQAKEFTATLPKNELGSRMLLLDNWNEWSEGHYLAPYREYGFGYLDAVRRVFSDAPTAHDDLLPEDIGRGPYDTAFRNHLQHEDKVWQLTSKVVTKGAPEPGLIGWWSFDETGDSPVALDYAGHKLGGEFLAKRAPGMDGNALLCEGGSVQVAPNGLLNPGRGLSIECWVKTDLAGQDNKWLVNHVFGGGTDSGYRLGILGGKPCFEVPLTAWSHHLQASEALPTGRWVHLAGTFDGQTMKIYMDGVERGTMHRPGPLKPNDLPLSLGNYEDKHSAHFTGLLDEVKLYDHALGANEVHQHYQQRAAAAQAEAETKRAK